MENLREKPQKPNKNDNIPNFGDDLGPLTEEDCEIGDWEPFEILSEQGESVTFLADALVQSVTDDRPELFIDFLGDAIRHYSPTKIARYSGLKRESLHKTINGTRPPNYSTLYKILRAIKTIDDERNENANKT